MKKRHPALWNGASGGRIVRIDNDREEAVLSFLRERDGDLVLAMFNLSNAEVTVTLEEHPQVSSPADALRGQPVDLTAPVSLPAWGYYVVTPGKSHTNGVLQSG